MDLLEKEEVIDTFLTAKLGRIDNSGYYDFSEHKSRVFVTTLRVSLEPTETFTERELATEALIMKGIATVIAHFSTLNPILKKSIVDLEVKHQMFNPNAAGSINIPIEQVDISSILTNGTIGVLTLKSKGAIPIKFETARHATRFQDGVARASKLFFERSS